MSKHPCDYWAVVNTGSMALIVNEGFALVKTIPSYATVLDGICWQLLT